MWGLIENNEIKKIINKPKGLVIGDTRHSRNIFSFRWTNEEREAIGIYEVVFDNSNKKDEAYYNNTNQSFNFADGVVTASFGSATAKAIADSLWTQADSDNGDLPDDKEVFDKMDPEIQEAVKFLINEIVVKRELKKLEKSENKA